MKNLTLQNKFSKLALSFMALFFSILSMAQESAKTPDISGSNTTTSTETWYTNPLYLVIGAIVLIILVAIIARGGKKN